jgi:methionine synthase I (cobalamin-dependent)
MWSLSISDCSRPVLPRRPVKIARGVAGENVFVASAMGPLGRPLAEVRAIAPQVVRNIFREQAEGLLDGSADLLIVETFGDTEELALAVRGSAPCAALAPT